MLTSHDEAASPHLSLRDFANVLREIIFAMRRLEAIDRPPSPETIWSATHKMTLNRDTKEWDAYVVFLEWYWELDGPADKWMVKGGRNLVAVG